MKQAHWNRYIDFCAQKLITEDIDYDLNDPLAFYKQLLNGATSWEHYSRGGLAEVYNVAIAAEVCTPSQWNRYRAHMNTTPSTLHGQELLELQARAYEQAALMLEDLRRYQTSRVTMTQLTRDNYLYIARLKNKRLNWINGFDQEQLNRQLDELFQAAKHNSTMRTPWKRLTWDIDTTTGHAVAILCIASVQLTKGNYWNPNNWTAATQTLDTLDPAILDAIMRLYSIIFTQP